MNAMKIGVIGNPNCGKTTLFNALTGAKQKVGNWPGVTVDRKSGHCKIGNLDVEVVDTPGIYSLTATSTDEKVASSYVMAKDYDLLINIIDASNLERNLYLTSQLLEMKTPLIIALNMMDVATEKRLKIDVERLEEQLGCPVIPMKASRGRGIQELLSAIPQAKGKENTPVTIHYPEPVFRAARELSNLLSTIQAAADYDTFWLSLKLLEDDEIANQIIRNEVKTVVRMHQHEIEEELDEDADILIASARYEFIAQVTAKSVRKIGEVSSNLSDTIDKVVLNKFLGLPIFLGAMYLMFMFTINLGGAFIDFFDLFFGLVCVDWLGQTLTNFGCPEWATTLIAGGLGGGIQTMATFIPPIGFMFLFLSFLEDSGYMARAAFVMDRAMQVIGLPGKAFIPLLIGFGCNVPAIMATRTMENQRDRTLAVVMNPFMSCGARLPVYTLFAAAFFPASGQNLVFALYLVGIGFAVFTGLLLKNTLLRGQVTPFVMELPPYNLPSFSSVILRAWDRLTAFLFRAGKVLMPVILILSFLNSIGSDGTFGNEDSDSSVLASIGKTITPVFEPMGVTEENWPATVGIFTGIFAKEAVVGTLDALYEQANNNAAEESGTVDLAAGIQQAFATIPANLTALTGTVLDPLGLSIGDISSQDSAAEELEISSTTLDTMHDLFGSRTAAVAYLLFVLLYFPCSAAIAAVYRETNLKWTLFVGAWTTGIAYTAATVYYQLGTFANHPASSTAWVIFSMVHLGLIAMIMRELGHDRTGQMVTGFARG